MNPCSVFCEKGPYSKQQECALILSHPKNIPLKTQFEKFMYLLRKHRHLTQGVNLLNENLCDIVDLYAVQVKN